MAKVTLKQPFYSAWQKYGWESGVEGLGVAERTVTLALANKQNLYIDTKQGLYKISPAKALAVTKYYKSYFNAKGKKLIVIPRNVCDKVNS